MRIGGRYTDEVLSAQVMLVSSVANIIVSDVIDDLLKRVYRLDISRRTITSPKEKNDQGTSQGREQTGR
ncbi:hypothetical protein CDAR_24391 [Caerostris darwini]|uniref:Uncharacterized protein n=1 Tax=Caerostris darwini TaxID=1538125 RepID=A0AAV4QHZ1_9ARAC|nr:hypothetical protein CDAR_24391 [Caerostris darwini]